MNIDEYKNMEKHYEEIPKFKKLLSYSKFIERVKRDDEIIVLANKLIDWQVSEEDQANAIEEVLSLVGEDDYDLLIHAGGKHTWTNTVKLFKKLVIQKIKRLCQAWFYCFKMSIGLVH
ncbi:MAG: hypothetical protein FWC69_02305 [Defluviitaleaceae bacterium]|nr:hypothetical protein [Defluviitaleaceae bacterium]